MPYSVPTQTVTTDIVTHIVDLAARRHLIGNDTTKVRDDFFAALSEWDIPEDTWHVHIEQLGSRIRRLRNQRSKTV